MPKPKYGTPEQRSRTRSRRAQQERDGGIPDREPIVDDRDPFPLPFKARGWRDVEIEPRLGYLTKWRAVDSETREVLHSAALKELVR